MTTIGMGPWATQMLGDMGADVIKVETSDGDIFRHVTPQRHRGMSHAFLNLNRNKRSVVLNLKTDEGREAMLRLIQGADVFVSNVRPASLQRLGLDYESLRPANPRLIYCGCYGYSESGPYAGRASVDDTIQAACSMASFQSERSGAPRYVKTAAADKVCSLFVAGSIAMALYARERTGLGQAIEVPMFECMVAFMMPEHLGGLTFEPPEGPAGYARILDPHRKPFRTKDGYIGVVPYNDLQWRRFFELAGRAELCDDARFRTQTDRSRNITVLYSFVEETLAHRTTAEWTALLQKADIPFSPVNSVDDLLKDAHLRAIGFWRDIAHPTEGRLRMPGIPVSFSRTPGSIRRHAPNVGEHTEEVLREAGQKRPRRPKY
ncbi:MAG: CoA transferase [Betaproteobacteria bacterium]|nr:MAG: CoA transferase [Betaproteobacteria bacterium]